MYSGSKRNVKMLKASQTIDLQRGVGSEGLYLYNYFVL